MNVHLGEIIKEQRVAQGLRGQELAVFAQVLKLELYELASVGTEYVKS